MQATPATWRLLLDAGWMGTMAENTLAAGKLGLKSLLKSCLFPVQVAVEYVWSDGDNCLVVGCSGWGQANVLIGSPIPTPPLTFWTLARSCTRWSAG